jgi:hypothetical protein
MTNGTEPSTDTYPDMVKHMPVTGKCEQVFISTDTLFITTRQLEMPRHALDQWEKYTHKKDRTN